MIILTEPKEVIITDGDKVIKLTCINDCNLTINNGVYTLECDAQDITVFSNEGVAYKDVFNENREDRYYEEV